MVEANTAIPADVQAEHAAKIGLTVNDAGVPVGEDGQPLHEMDLRNLPKGLTVNYADVPVALSDSIEAHATIGDHDLPPGVDPTSAEAVEYEAARAELEKLETQSGDFDQPSPSQNQLAAAHARYKAADAWRQAALAEHRRTVQLAHGVPIGSPDRIVFNTSTETTPA